jgi:hypothetical protein
VTCFGVLRALQVMELIMKNQLPAWPIIAVLIPVSAHAATLRSETVEAWDAYVQTMDENLRERTRPGGSFLWAFEDPERAAKVRGGELVAGPVSAQNPKKVPGGLIHHWIGAAFLPGTSIDRTLEVARDYDRYKEFYNPFVIDSKLIGRDGLEDRFTMQIMNKALFLKNALDADYLTNTVVLDGRRAYSVARTTRVQEIEEYGHPGQHKDAEGTGGGYIWKLHSVLRMEQRDGGVYIEIEAVALSREIPSAFRFIVEPIVRKVSRNSLLTSLQQTGQAVRGHSTVATKPAVISTDAGQFGTTASAFSNKTTVNADLR